MSLWKFIRPCLALALLATSVACAGAQDLEREAARLAEMARRRLVEMDILDAQRQRDVPFDQFDQMIFQQDRTAAAARRRQDTLLAAQVHEIDQACKLSDAQRKKLLLAGRGDIRRFFGRYEVLKAKWGPSINADQDHMALQKEIMPVQMAMRSGLFHEDSLLHKSLPNTLTAEQLARHEVIAKERREARHRSSIETAIRSLEQGKPFPEAQRRELLALLTQVTKPARRPSEYDQYRIMFQLSRLPPEKLESLFGKERWGGVSLRLAQFAAVEPRLRQFGHLPPEDDDESK